MKSSAQLYICSALWLMSSFGYSVQTTRQYNTPLQRRSDTALKTPYVTITF